MFFPNYYECWTNEYSEWIELVIPLIPLQRFVDASRDKPERKTAFSLIAPATTKTRLRWMVSM